jgi:hypothetical protein
LDEPVSGVVFIPGVGAMRFNKLTYIAFLMALCVLIVMLGLTIFIIDEIGLDEDNIISGVVSLLPSALMGLAFGEAGEIAGDRGDDTTGQVSAWLFGISCLPVAFNLIANAISRQAFIRSSIKEQIKRLNSWQRIHLMPFHTYLSLFALAVAGMHYLLSSCPSTSLPELGLISMSILVGTGLIIKLKIAPKSSRKWVYQFHANLIVSGILVAVLVLGHLIIT